MLLQINSSRLNNYIQNVIRNRKIELIPKGAKQVRITKLTKLSGGISDSKIYTFSLVYYENHKLKELELVLKLYPPNERDKCYNENEVLRTLRAKNFPVPHVYICEINEEHLGMPFIIMEKIDGTSMGKYLRKASYKEKLEIIKHFAKTLAFQHSLKLENFELENLKRPVNEYEYANRQASSARAIQKNLNIKINFDNIISWIESHASIYPCSQHSIIHNDIRLDNFLITKEKRIVSIDWESPEIGDPLKDVALAYHNLIFLFGFRKLNEGAKLAKFFIYEYARNSKEEVDYHKLRFYVVASALIEIFCYRFNCKQTLNPLTFVRKFGLTYLPALPYLSWYFWWRAKNLERLINTEINYPTLDFV